MTNAEFYLEDLKTKFNKINPKEYYLSYSGEKDSHLLYWFIKEYAKIKDIKVIGINTYMEHPDIRERIYNNCDKVLLPKLKPFEIKEKYGIPCFSKEQDFYIYYYQLAIRKGKKPAKTYLDKINGTYHTGFNISKKAREYVLSGNAHPITHLCCHFLKKEPARSFEKESGLKPIFGVRGSESNLRKRQYTSCFTKDKKFSPIWDLEDKLMEQIYDEFQIEIPEVYKTGIKRTRMHADAHIGSYCGDTQKELKIIDNAQRKFVTELFKESYEVLGIKY